MDADNLVVMANRIGEHYAGFADRAEAEDGVATHIARYWAPRMRSALLERLDGDHGDLLPLVAVALRAHRARLVPAAVRP